MATLPALVASPGRQLDLLSRARQLLAEARSVPEAKDTRDRLKAVADYLRKRGDSFEAARFAAQMRLRFDRRLGQLLAEGGERRGGNFRGGSSAPLPDGVNHAQSFRWQRIASVPESDFEDYLEAALEPTTADVLKMAAAHVARQERAARKKAGCTVRDLHALAAAGRTFRCIYADPPWRYENQATRASTDDHYVTMGVDEIAALPVGKLAAPQSHLWLWTTNAFLFECPKLFDAWGFEFKSSYVWVKPQMGIGNYLRNSHEFLLLAVRGGLVGAAKDVRSWGEFGRDKHSAKPEEVRRDVVERVSPGPYLELFARRAVEGWTCWGNEAGRPGRG